MFDEMMDCEATFQTITLPEAMMNSDPATTKQMTGPDLLVHPEVNGSPIQPAASPGYAHSATIWISPRVLRLIVPAMVIALTIFLFLPWTGAYPSGYPAYTQNALQTIWGSVTVDPVAAEALDTAKPYDKVERNPLMLFYVLSVLFALVLVATPLAVAAYHVKTFPPIVDAIWRRRQGALAASALLAFVVLMTQMWLGFGFEAAVAAKTDKSQAAAIAAAKTPEEREKANIHRGLETSSFNVHRSRWLHLTVACNAALVVALGLEFWLKRRGDRPLPRIVANA